MGQWVWGIFIYDYIRSWSIIMTYSDNYNIRTKNVKFNDVADAIDGSLTRSYGGLTTGTSSVYIATPTPAWSSYAVGMMITILPHVANAVGATLNVSGLGAIAIRRNGAAIIANTFVANSAVQLFYNGTQFDIIAIDSTTPVGTIVMTGRSTAPTGWLLCNGTEVPIASYSELSTAIGTTFNTGGETVGYFRLPDLRRRIPVGVGASDTLGNTEGGNKTGTAYASRSISHSHTVPAHYHGMGAGATLNITSSGGGGQTGGQSAGHSHTFSGTTGAANAKFYRLVHNAGGNRAPNHGVGYSGGVFTDYTDNQYLNADHTHNFSGSTAGESNDHTHAAPNHTHGAGNFSGVIGLVTGGVNGNEAMASGPITPPCLFLNYIIKA